MKGFLQSLPVVGKVFVDIQPEEVWAFWRFMQDHYRTTVVNKRDALEMQLVAQALDALGIQSRDRFLRNFTTTLGRRIYTPFEVSYLADRAARARWEAEAYRSNLELHFWRHGTTPSARRIAEVLSDYGCRPEDVDVAAKSLALSAVSVRKGAVINEATHVALGWLDEHVPRLRAKGVA